jgi:hypothetical protein
MEPKHPKYVGTEQSDAPSEAAVAVVAAVIVLIAFIVVALLS